MDGHYAALAVITGRYSTAVNRPGGGLCAKRSDSHSPGTSLMPRNRATGMEG